ncbi:MAG TPA: hypothetical protein VD948_07745 [Rhodothermales bacterium]|nr:hypothetical protein [Rhodothermales bacterium]
MPASQEFTLELTPSARFDLVDVNTLLREAHGDVLHGFRRALYVSYHTTAGYLDEPACSALGHDGPAVRALVNRYRGLYPEGAGYHHDRLEARTELSDEQKQTEPLNGDAHLSFIGSGLAGCVSYARAAQHPAWFVDLDGVGPAGPRLRRTTVVGYDEEAVVERFTLPVQAPHAIEAINLRDPRLGLLDEVEARVRKLGLSKGRVDLRLAPTEEDGAALTVNEYETLLMQHDLAEVLRNPFRHAARRGWHALRDPRHVKEKTKDYLKYDMLVLLNDRLDHWRLRGTAIERLTDALVRKAALKYLRMKRAVSLPVSDQDLTGQAGAVVQGTYQSPILVQWHRPRTGVRLLEARIVAFR